MLQYEFNVLDETLAQRLRDADVYDIAVIDWWNYAHESRIFRGKPLNSRFRSIIQSFTGYYHWSTPMVYLSNILAGGVIRALAIIETEETERLAVENESFAAVIRTPEQKDIDAAKALLAEHPYSVVYRTEDGMTGGTAA